MTTRRFAAITALVLGAATFVLLVIVIARGFPPNVVVLVAIVLIPPALWYGVRRRGVGRVLGLFAAGLLLLIAILFFTNEDRALADLVLIGCAALTLGAARAAFSIHVALPHAAPPQRAVLFWNPRSGGGKATQFDLPAEAAARGIEAVELRPGEDLESLVRDAVARGADGLAMAGGDGSQALVAAVAAEQDLPYACIPAGTRNHFALDLGVDRDDVVGALDAFVDGGERRVDLGVVNGRVFVNNVSLGLYAEAVRQKGYREAKIRTILNTVPDVLGPGDDQTLDLRWTGPDGDEHRSAAVILVSNNVYRLGRVFDSGTRPRIDDGLLGITVLGKPRGRGRRGRSAQRPWRDWSAASFDVRSAKPVPAGVDGESLLLDAPLRFEIRPLALRVRIAPQHPGASPSAIDPDGLVEAARALVAIALGRPRYALPGVSASRPGSSATG